MQHMQTISDETNIRYNKEQKSLIKRLLNFCEEISKNKIAYIMALPAIILTMVFSYIPLYYLITAFKRYRFTDGIFGSPWVGMDNFEIFFFGGKAFQVTFNTLWINLLMISIGTVVTIFLALMVNEIKNRVFNNITQTIYFFPNFISWVIIGEIIYNIFSSDYGSMNIILSYFGIEPMAWYKHPEYWRTILVVFSVIKGSGFGTLVYLATLSGMDPSYYEAAKVDGATRLQCIFRITLPMLKPTILVLTLFSLGRVFFGDFGMIYGVVRDVGPILEKVEVIDTYLFRAFRQTGSVGLSVAIGLYQSLFGFITIVVCNLLVKRYNEGNALF